MLARRLEDSGNQNRTRYNSLLGNRPIYSKRCETYSKVHPQIIQDVMIHTDTTLVSYYIILFIEYVYYILYNIYIYYYHI